MTSFLYGGCVMVLYLQYNKRCMPLSGVGYYLERNHKVGQHVTTSFRCSSGLLNFNAVVNW